MRKWFLLFLVPTFLAGCEERLDVGERTVLHSERFGELRIYRPKEEPDRVVLFFSAKGGWDAESESIAQAIQRENGFVVGVDSKNYLNALQQDEEDCHYIAGEIERLLQSSEKGAALKHFHPGLLAGIGAGAFIAKSAFLQHPSSFLGVLALREERTFAPCEEGELSLAHGVPAAIQERVLENPRESLQTSLVRLTKAGAAVAATELEGSLPLVTSEPMAKGDRFAIFYSGDGGWASIDQELAHLFESAEIPVVGVDSLRYFWRKRTPEEGGRDLSEMIERYSALYARDKVLLVGFSFGADILPAFYNHLPANSRALVKGMVLLSPALETDFEIHISGWIGYDEVEKGNPIAPELEKIPFSPLCLFGEEEKGETVCETSKRVSAIELPGDHHFNGEYEKVFEKLKPVLQ